MKDLHIKCTRCRHKHKESERLRIRDKKYSDTPVFTLVCPRCGCKNYYDITLQVAWCWANGLIEIGDVHPEDTGNDGAITVATGPKYALRSHIETVARNGKGSNEGLLFVPGVPEADGQREAIAALNT